MSRCRGWIQGTLCRCCCSSSHYRFLSCSYFPFLFALLQAASIRHPGSLSVYRTYWCWLGCWGSRQTSSMRRWGLDWPLQPTKIHGCLRIWWTGHCRTHWSSKSRLYSWCSFGNWIFHRIDWTHPIFHIHRSIWAKSAWSSFGYRHCCWWFQGRSRSFWPACWYAKFTWRVWRGPRVSRGCLGLKVCPWGSRRARPTHCALHCRATCGQPAWSRGRTHAAHWAKTQAYSWEHPRLRAAWITLQSAFSPRWLSSAPRRPACGAATWTTISRIWTVGKCLRSNSGWATLSPQPRCGTT